MIIIRRLVVVFSSACNSHYQTSGIEKMRRNTMVIPFASSSKSPKYNSLALALAQAVLGINMLGAMACYALAAEPTATEPTSSTAKLPTVKVTADVEAVESYVAKRSTTATKTDTLLRDVPQSVSVITREQIRDQGVQGLADAVRFIPGLNMSQGEGNRDTAVFRGNASTGDFFLDGVRDDVQYIRDLYNIERVEVLKGSNAMIFGRGGSGGVINRVSKEANWSNEREVSVALGSWNNRRVSADIDQAINTDVAARLNLLYESSENYRDGFNLERYGINPTATFKLGDSTLATLSYEYFNDERVADRGVTSWQGKPVKVDSSTFFGDADNSLVTARVNIVNALIEHEVNETVHLRNRTRVADYDKFYQNVFAGAINTTAVGANPAGSLVAISAYNNSAERTNLFNQTDLTVELQIGTIKHKLLTGVELGKQNTDNFRETGYFTNPANPTGTQLTSIQVPLANPFATPIDFRQSATDANNTSEAKVAAIYLQDQISFTPQLLAVIGVRYDRFESDVTNDRTGAEFSAEDHLVSPRVGLTYKPIEVVSVYTSYSLAFVPRSGDQLASLSLSNQALDPEKFTNLELGAKWDIGQKISATAAVYDLLRSNVAVINPEDPTELLLTSGDSQRTKGVELSLTGNITASWNMSAGYSHQDGEITQDIRASATAITHAGSVLANTPKQTLSLWNRYDLNSQWGFGVGIINRSEVFASIDNKVTLPDFTRVDAAAFYRLSKEIKVQANIENLLSQGYYVSANSNNNITPGSPLAVRVALTLGF
jgi:catecholate siderophore receptor